MENKLLVKDVSKRFGDTWVLRDVRASVPPGKITAFIGPNGAGKTTLFNVISGNLRPDSGAVIFQGKDITGMPSHSIAERGIGRQFQDVRVFGGLTAVENVEVALIPGTHHSVWRTWFGTRETAHEMNEIRRKAMESLEYVGLADYHDHLARELSFGQQKLLSLARLFARRFSCLLLDEPTAGVSHQMVDKIVALIQRAVKEHNLTVTAFIEHNMSAVQDLADWIHFLHEGRVAFSGKSDHVLGHRTVRELYMGI